MYIDISIHEAIPNKGEIPSVSTIHAHAGMHVHCSVAKNKMTEANTYIEQVHLNV